MRKKWIRWKKLIKVLLSVDGGQLKPKYRILRIEKDDEDNYLILVQIINKNHVFRMRPEEILADDALTDSFFPRDSRTLTYLGYLGINSPKYKILARRFKENKQMIFAIRAKNQKEVLVKTSDEISADSDMILDVCNGRIGHAASNR